MSVVKFSPIVTQVLEAANYTHAMHPNRITTIHDIECPPGKGWVVSLLGPNYMGNPAEEASVQLMVDAADVGQGGTLGMQMYHIGGPGNQLSNGIEQAGYASFTRAMFLGTETPGATYVRPNGVVVTWTQQNNIDMAAQLELLARVLAELNRTTGLPLVQLTLDQLRQAHDDYEAGRDQSVAGICRHMDWTAAGASNTTHEDPSDNYPMDVLLAKANAYAHGTPTPTPAPAPTDLLEDIMALDRTSADYKNLVADIAASVWTSINGASGGGEGATLGDIFTVSRAIKADTSTLVSRSK